MRKTVVKFNPALQFTKLEQPIPVSVAGPNSSPRAVGILQVPIVWETGKSAIFTMLVVPNLTWPSLFGQNHLRQTDARIYSKDLRVFSADPAMNFEIKATFTLHRFHFDPFLLPKTELFSSLFTLLRFQTETDIYQLVFTIFLKNASVFLFLTTRPSTLLILAISNCSVFGVHTTELRFCLAPFSFSSVFIIVFI